jgi:hypothetical protein
MPEPSMIVMSFQEFAELMVKHQGIHEGHWGIFIKFGIGAVNASGPDGKLLPTALVPVREIGLQRFDAANNLTVDAAEVNPLARAARVKNRAKSSRAKRKRT